MCFSAVFTGAFLLICSSISRVSLLVNDLWVFNYISQLHHLDYFKMFVWVLESGVSFNSQYQEPDAFLNAWKMHLVQSKKLEQHLEFYCLSKYEVCYICGHDGHSFLYLSSVQSRSLMHNMVNSILACISSCVSSRTRTVMPCAQHWWGHILSPVFRFFGLSRKTWRWWIVSRERQWSWGAAEGAGVV